MCSQKRGAKSQRREQSNSGRVGLRSQSESDSRRCERDTRERKIPRPFFLPFSFFLFLIQDVVAKSLCAVEEREQTGVSHGSNRERQPHYQPRLLVLPLPPFDAKKAGGNGGILVSPDE